jgi:hypothetical protein
MYFTTIPGISASFVEAKNVTDEVDSEKRSSFFAKIGFEIDAH